MYYIVLIQSFIQHQNQQQTQVYYCIWVMCREVLYAYGSHYWRAGHDPEVKVIRAGVMLLLTL